MAPGDLQIYIYNHFILITKTIKRSWEKSWESIDHVSGRVYSCCMAKHEVVNQIIDYLDERRTELSNEMASVAYNSNDHAMLDAMYEVYDHLITKLEDDYR